MIEAERVTPSLPRILRVNEVLEVNSNVRLEFPVSVGAVPVSCKIGPAELAETIAALFTRNDATWPVGAFRPVPLLCEMKSP